MFNQGALLFQPPSSPYLRGFSLVEVALALAVAGFCLIALVSLLPLSISNYQRADAQSAMVNLAMKVVSDLQATPPTTSNARAVSPQFKFSIPSAGGNSDATPQTVYVNNSGVPSSSGGPGQAPASGSIYRISVAFFPPATAPTATTARVLVTFPAQADPAPAMWPVKYTDVFQTVVSLNRN